MKIPRNNDNIENENDRSLTRKHVAERNRRARINHYLEEIEKLITPSLSQMSPNAKLEKAEVLERTVDYIKQHRTSEMNTHQNYIQGFSECIRSIQAFLVTMKVSEGDVRHIFHSCLSSARNRLQKSNPGNQTSSANMTHNNLNRLRNMESLRTRTPRNILGTSNSSMFTSSAENIKVETVENMANCQDQHLVPDDISEAPSVSHPGHDLNEMAPKVQNVVGSNGETSKRAFGVLKEVVSNNQTNCVSNTTLSKDETTRGVDLSKRKPTSDASDASDANDCENEGAFMDIAEENINPDCDDPVWRPW